MAKRKLASWNHRVVRFTEADGSHWYEFREVTYDKGEVPTGHADVCLGSDTDEGMKELVRRLRHARKRPVLVAKGNRETGKLEKE